MAQIIAWRASRHGPAHVESLQRKDFTSEQQHFFLIFLTPNVVFLHCPKGYKGEC